MDIYLVVNSLVSICLLGMGIAVLVKDVKSKSNIYFMLFAVSLATWIMSNYYSNDFSLSHAIALLMNRIIFIAASSMMFFLALFLSAMVNRKKKILEKIMVIMMVVSIFISLTPLVVDDIFPQGNEYAIEFGIFTPVLVLIIIAFIIYSIVVLVSAVKQAGTVDKKRVKNMRSVLIIFTSTLVFTNSILPMLFDIYVLTPVGLSVMSMYLVFSFGGMIINGKLFNINATILRKVLSSTLIFLLSAVYYSTVGLLIYAIFKIFHMQDDLLWLLIVPPFVASMNFMTYSLREKVEVSVKNLLLSNYYNINEVIDKVNKKMLSANSVNNVIKTIGNTIEETVNAKACLIFSEKGEVAYKYGKFHREIVEELKSTPSELFNEDIVFLDKMQWGDNQLKNLLFKHKVDAVMRLSGDKAGLNGENIFICLGGKKDGGSYSDKDIKLLLAVSNCFVIGLKNVLQMMRIQEFNDVLTIKINEATKELVKKNKLLEKQDEQKNEFLSIASHQLKTPLTSLRGNLSMLADGDYGAVNATQRDIMLGVENQAALMSSLVSDFLDVSRLQSGKFVVDKKMIDITEVLTAQIDLVKKIAVDRKITMTLHIGSNIPKINADDGKISQVIMNFMDNAIYYSPEGSEINVFLEGGEQTVEFKVMDQGIGVPRKEQEKLFTKFYRVHNAQKMRRNGVGIGLFLAKKIIDGHNGEIIFESKEGKGSTFGFRIPIN